MQANSSPLLLRSAPDTTRTQCRRFTPTCKRHSALLFVLASLMFVSDLWMVYSEPLLDSLVVSPSSATLVNSCGIPFIGFQSASVSFIGFLQLLGVVSLALLLFIFLCSLSYLRPVQVGGHVARPLVVTI